MIEPADVMANRSGRSRSGPPPFRYLYADVASESDGDDAVLDHIRQDAAECWMRFLLVPTLQRYLRALDPYRHPRAALETAALVIEICPLERDDVCTALSERYPRLERFLATAAARSATNQAIVPKPGFPKELGGTLDNGLLRFKVQSFVASGSGGHLFLAEDRTTLDDNQRNDARLVLKLLPAQRHDGRSWQQEAATAAAVGSPCGIRIVDSGIAPTGHGYIVMERVDGLTLIALAASEQMPPPRHVGAELAHLAEALEGLHETGLGHGDIHPANVMLDRVGHLRLLDYGKGSNASASEDVRSLCALSLWVTLGYLPPPGTTVPWQWSPMRAAVVESAVDALNNPRTAGEFAQGLRERLRRARIRRNTFTTLLIGTLLAALMYLGESGQRSGPGASHAAGTTTHQTGP